MIDDIDQVARDMDKKRKLYDRIKEDLTSLHKTAE